MATPIAALRPTPQRSEEDAYVQDVVNEITSASPPSAAPPPPPPPPKPYYRAAPPSLPAQQQQQQMAYYPQPPPAPPRTPGLVDRLATPEAKAAAVAAAVAAVVWSPFAADLVDGLIDRSPLRGQRLLARALLAGALVHAVLEGLRRV